MEEKTEIVEGCDLRHGDVLVEWLDANKQRLSAWGYTKIERHNGQLCYYSESIFSSRKPGWVADDRFSAGNWYRVASPRPEPESNEFGPVSP